MTAATATYMYAITRPIATAELAELSGVCGAAVRTVATDGIACLVSTVDLDTFGEEPLRDHLEDLGWLQRVAGEHDAVVRAGAALGTTAPLRLATVCADDEAVRARLREVAGGAARLLGRLDGRDEWGVKVLGGFHAAEPVSATATSGTAYLQQRRAALTARERLAAAEARQADDVYAHLLPVSVAGHRHRPQDQRLSGLGRPMVLNAAFLVDRERLAEFRAAVDEVARALPTDALLLTGPWPPYSFAALDES